VTAPTAVVHAGVLRSRIFIRPALYTNAASISEAALRIQVCWIGGCQTFCLRSNKSVKGRDVVHSEHFRVVTPSWITVSAKAIRRENFMSHAANLHTGRECNWPFGVQPLHPLFGAEIVDITLADAVGEQMFAYVCTRRFSTIS